MHKVGIGIIGCGNISSAYLKAMAAFPILDIRGLADLNEDLAAQRAWPVVGHHVHTGPHLELCHRARHPRNSPYPSPEAAPARGAT